MKELNVSKVWKNASGQGYTIAINDFFEIYVKHFFGYEFTEIVLFSPVKGNIVHGLQGITEQEIYSAVLDCFREVLRRYESTYKKSNDTGVKILAMLERQKLLNKLEKGNITL